MKKIILSASIMFLAIGAMAQEKEINSALSAYESNNASAAKSELDKVANQINSNKVRPELKAKYFYVAGQIALQNGNTIEAAKMFGELAKYESGTMYSIRNKSTKETEYFATEAEATSAAATGDYSKPKTEKLSGKYLPQVQDKLRNQAEIVLQLANSAYNSNNKETAGDKFLEGSYLVNALGGNGDLFKYNAALSYHSANKYEKALDTYVELLNDGYTGEATSYVGKDKEGKDVSLNSKDEAENYKKLGLISTYKEVKTPSIEKDIYVNALKAVLSMKKDNPIVQKAEKKYPNDEEIKNLISSIYLSTGNTEQFLNSLLENIKNNPNDASNYYNVGTVYMEKNEDAKAIEYFEKAIQKDPKYKNAYNNLALVKVKKEKEYVDIINANLGNSSKEKQNYKEYTEKRKNLYIEIIPLLEKAFELDKTDYNAAKTLRQAYQAAEMFDKEDELRAIEKQLQPK
ncbi:tetratricopeptide repeat protein [Moheibacter stercoris]|uniref:Tetratricopeptide (TPR) repeat protein n=1 Tax=Moheibacter stercoris TaxID=1628251 RepID=A0ABV2LWG0_9FLAO